jgi:hypothetical protein
LDSSAQTWSFGRELYDNAGRPQKRIHTPYQLRKVLGLESVKDADGKIVQEAPLPEWANFRQRALDTAILEITKKTDLKISIKSLERSKHRLVTSVTFVIKEQAVPNR